ncbi:fungal-specific transcription factor domain-containing protein [Mycena maculata]|uniref:Fungal-specific transcription factor domain-containing protein n=1 Tax=Mycena maculata TaxID=230809 RepID=A0AAD7MVK8_9AGAR|nr:fungal-specific transcription factor domain-containing protein [Mycena maculata]
MTSASAASLHILRMALRSLSCPPPPFNADDLKHLDISRTFERMTLGKKNPRFIGKSSSANLLQATIDLKADVRRNGNGNAGACEDHGREDDEVPSPWTSRRLQFWRFKPWETTAPRPVAFLFPPSDLAAHLIDLYFANTNSYMPLLHRPTFERNVEKRLHHQDDGFAAVLMLVCAIASRWSDDPRVLGANRDEQADPLACGWQWFDQVPLVERHLFGHATLYDLQRICLAVQFLEAFSSLHSCWTLLGVGIRLAQDVGAHRRKSQHETPSVERELWKRAFWILVYLDRTKSSGMGGACAIQYDDSFDLEFPIECDDEYWEHPTHPFQQPAGVPSRIAFFKQVRQFVRLRYLLTIQSQNIVKIMFSIGDDWEERVVAEFDSALNRWRDGVPTHLRWDPARADPLFFDQSVALHCAYYHLQILIHRPFIPMMRRAAPTALPSLAICLSAARACANMVDIQRQRKGGVAAPINLGPVLTSALVLLLNMWSGKRAGLVPDTSREIPNVNKCMEVVRLCETRWQWAGMLRYWVLQIINGHGSFMMPRDILSELASVGQLPLQDPNTLAMAGTGHRHHQQSTAGNANQELRVLFSSSSVQRSSDGGISDSQFRAPYMHLPQVSFATGTGAAGMRASEVTPMEPSALVPNPLPNTWLTSADPFASMTTDPTQATRELADLTSLIDSDAIAIWTNVPNGFEVDDWGNYFNTFSEITHGQPMAHGGTNTSGY